MRVDASAEAWRAALDVLRDEPRAWPVTSLVSRPVREADGAEAWDMVLAMLRERLGSDVVAFRRSAARALGVVVGDARPDADVAARRLLVECAVRDADPDVRRAAFEELASGRRPLPELQRLLDDDVDGGLRVGAAALQAREEPRAALPLLLDALVGDDAAERAAARRALAPWARGWQPPALSPGTRARGLGRSNDVTASSRSGTRRHARLLDELLIAMPEQTRSRARAELEALRERRPRSESPGGRTSGR